MKIKHYTPHIFSLCALSVLGNAIISMPLYNSGGFLSILISVVLSLALILLTTLLTNLGNKNKVVFYVLTALVSVIAIYSAGTVFVDYIGFLRLVQMPQTSLYLLSAVIVIVVIFFALNSISAIYKYCLFVAVIGAIMIAICFLGGIKNFDFTNFMSSFFKFQFNTKDFLRSFSSLAIIPFFASLTLKRIPAKPLVLGTSAGFLVLTLCLSQSIFTLGLANDISYPYLKSVSVISSGSLFTRLDGFIYFIFFITALVKIAVCVKTIYLIIKNLKRSA